MILEDHVGDIIRKARLHAGVSLESASAAAGLSVPELEMIEDSGNPARPVPFSPLAALIGLDAAKLQQIAAGWAPPVPDLSQWRELRVVTTSAGMSVNAYLVWDEVTRDAAVFDTGFDAEPLIALIEEQQLQLRYVFITHGHADHVAGLEALRARYPKARLRGNSKSAPPDQRNRSNDFLMLGSLRITNRDTPGHAEDGVTYLIGTWPEDAPHVAVVGDAIFAGSMGKAPGNAALAKEKVVKQILSLPPATLICPGHGPLTTVADEKAHNPFF